MTRPPSPSGSRPPICDWKSPPDTRLQDVLFAQGVEFPCGGRGRCKGCRVKVLRGALNVTAEEKNLLTGAELEAGWRLACRQAIAGDLELELAQWEMSVLSDESTFAFQPRQGLGVAIDLGTTTIATQLLDLRNGNVLGVQTALNAQARHGGDIMSRVEFAIQGGQVELQRLVREQLGGMLGQLLGSCAGQAAARDALPRVPDDRLVGPTKGGEELKRMVIVGNTVMHHLFCGVAVAPLAAHPFEPEQSGRVQISPRDLGWKFRTTRSWNFCRVSAALWVRTFWPASWRPACTEVRELMALMDLGTNGEVVVGNRERMLCTSTAAGPAFEGARISMGMRAATGAISQVQVEDNFLACRVLGGGAPLGLCGSGLVDAVAAGLELEWIHPSGRMVNRSEMPLAGLVSLLAADVRELQLAKGAIAAGLRMLTAKLGASLEDLQQLHLAGAFGNYISRASAQRIGLLRVPLNRVVPAGNTALLGAKRALFEEATAWDTLSQQVEHVSLNESVDFEDIYAEEMRFPG